MSIAIFGNVINSKDATDSGVSSTLSTDKTNRFSTEILNDEKSASSSFGIKRPGLILDTNYKRDSSDSIPRSPLSATFSFAEGRNNSGTIIRGQEFNDEDAEFFFPQNKQTTSSLEKIIEDSTSREQFRTFLSTRSAEENLAFLMALKRLSSNNVRQTYYWYICEDSPYEINITSACASELISTYRKINGNATASEWYKIFSKAKLEVINLLQCVVPEFNSWAKKQYTLWTELKPNQKRVLIIGGGPCGVMCANMLQGMGAFQVALVSKADYIEFKPALIHVNDPNEYDKYNLSLSDVLQNTKLALGEVTNVTKTSVNIGENTIEYDYLVIATGKSYKLGPTWAPAAGITREYNKKAMSLQANAIKGSNSILITGGTPFGVGVAAEILTKYPEKKVILLEKENQLFASEAYNMVGAGDVAKRYLERLGCQVHTNVLVTATISDPDKSNLSNVHLADGTVFAVELVINAHSGIVNTSIISDTSMLNSLGYIKVDKTLLVEGTNNIFAGGVCAAPIEGMSHTFINSLISGCIIARNICREYKGKELSFAGHKGFPDYVKETADPLAAIYIGNKAFGRFGLLPLGKRSPEYLGTDAPTEDLVLSHKYSDMHLAAYNFWQNSFKNSRPAWLGEPPKKLSCSDYQKNKK